MFFFLRCPTYRQPANTNTPNATAIAIPAMAPPDSPEYVKQCILSLKPSKLSEKYAVCYMISKPIQGEGQTTFAAKREIRLCKYIATQYTRKMQQPAKANTCLL